MDSSASAVEQARRNAALNGFRNVEVVQADVFAFLEEQMRKKKTYDVVILDPPSFTRSRRNVSTARRGYRNINEQAFRILNPEGILVTASCSFHIYEEVFYEIVQDAARRAGRTIRLLEWRRQGPDHPILPAMPETMYLKLGIFQVM